MVRKICDVELKKNSTPVIPGLKKFKSRQTEVKKNSRPGHIFPDPVIPINNERSLREQIIGTAMVSKRGFDNVTCDCSCSSYAL